MKEYAFEMFFDSSSDAAIRSIWKKLQEAGLPSFMFENHSTPHLTVGVYKAIDIPNASALLIEFCRHHHPIPIYLAFVATFISKENVVFIAPNMTEALRQMHQQFHQAFALYSTETQVYYLPNNWQPHCTMAMEVPEKNYMEVFATIRKYFTPFEVRIQSIALVEYRPAKIIKECLLE